MSVNAKENDYTCKTCKYWDDDGCFCMHNGMNAWSEDTCDDWTDPDDIKIYDLTEEESYDGGVMSNFDNENPKEVEDYINEGREIE